MAPASRFRFVVGVARFDQVFDREARLSQSEARLQVLERETEAERQTLRARIAELEALAARQPAGDDLKLIHGIGPALEKMLHKLGVRTFRQIATWSDEEIEQIDAQLERFRGRIRRDDWVGSAKREHFNKYNEEL